MTDPKLAAVLGNSQKLDGGAMFGNAPKALWQRWMPADERNRIELACRCLLVSEPGGRRILFETGIGAFFEPELRERFGVQEEEHVLLAGLAELGVTHEEIDVVVLSHLHFDHAGGLLGAWSADRPAELLFPKARYVTSQEAWERARVPHPRDRASFVPQLLVLLENSERLELVAGESSEVLGAGYRFHRSDGHTPGMLLAEISTESGPLVFAADLVPGHAWVRRAITMGYDRFPELLIDEKDALLRDLLERNGRLFFTHDPQFASCSLERDERGRIVPAQLSSLPL